ncbi:hypothetical protein ONS95_011414 [Cadophora gregata]|uniref:uncharacterized protein n=1 Tax=Cadophora gregata TaxID=51156 RepID=UPI0026DDC5CB|nr:uncharacterized protein ONS95_011414 [Cadophora gregata]KAK0119993.1 hypothetical protein ONS95_011414 [Cadophora gregata]KAK0121030.1 hypothetical protein ONS96_011218 [Cadophora gregata f. sp. sojae]
MPAKAATLNKLSSRTHSELLPLPFLAHTKEQRKLGDLLEQLYDQNVAAREPTDLETLLNTMPAWTKEKVQLYANEQAKKRNPFVEYESLSARIPREPSTSETAAAYYEAFLKSKNVSEPKKSLRCRSPQMGLTEIQNGQRYGFMNENEKMWHKKCLESEGEITRLLLLRI